MSRTATAIVVTLLCACFEDGRGYSVRVRNIGTRQIDETRVSYGKFTSDAGVVVAKAADTHLQVREPLPQTAFVEWTDADGRRHRETVEVSFPHGFKGVLVFDIDDSNHVHVLTEPPPQHIVN